MRKKNLRELKPEFLRLYVEEKKSIREIAKIYNINKTSVSRYIYEDIKPRKRGLTDEQKILAKELYGNHYSLRAIANEISASQSTIKAYLIREYGELRTSRPKKFEHLVDSFIQDYENGLSSLEIAKKYKVSPSTILNYIGENNVKARNYSEASIKYKVNDDYFDVLDKNKAYMLGLIIGISSESKKASMEFIDLRVSRYKEDIANKILDTIYLDEYPTISVINKNLYVVRLASKKLVNRILELKNQFFKKNKVSFSEIELYREDILKGLIDSSVLKIDNGICFKSFKNQVQTIKSELSKYLNIEKSSKEYTDILSEKESLKKLGLTFSKGYSVYKVKNIKDYNLSNINLNIKKDDYIIFFHRDQEFNTVKDK